VIGQPLPCGREPNAASVGFDQRGAGLLRKHPELLGNRRGRVPELVGDRSHRPQARQFEQQFEAADFHGCEKPIVRFNRTFCQVI
jgi:hypothetical protein